MSDLVNAVLREAITRWRAGETIPLDIAARLIEAGYDVEKLEEHYRG